MSTPIVHRYPTSCDLVLPDQASIDIERFTMEQISVSAVSCHVGVALSYGFPTRFLPGLHYISHTMYFREVHQCTLIVL